MTASCSGARSGARTVLLLGLLALVREARGQGLQRADGNLKSYNNYSVLRTTPSSEEQVAALRALDGQPGVQWWTPPRRNAPADVMLSPEAHDAVLRRLAELGLRYEVLHNNLQDSIGAVSPVGRRSRSVRSRGSSSSSRTPPFPALPRSAARATTRHNGEINRELAAAQLAQRFITDSFIDNKRYLLYDEIEEYIERVAANHPNKVRIHDIGPTFEGRRMRVVQLSNCFLCNYSAVWVDAGIHAREWIAPATALYALSQLAENETYHADMREQLDWFFLPVANPDGYQFTHTTDRLWRKTRSTTSMPGCYGADPNRNFDFHWNEIGASKNPCSETYAGRTPLSEIEAKNIRNFMWENRSRFKLYISYHSYGNFILYPWGFTAENPKDWQTLKSVAENVNAAMVRAGSEPYTIGSSTQTLYAAAGGSDDWAKGIAGIPLSYTIELPGYKFGFQLPPKYIDQVARQSFEGLRVFAREVKRLKNTRSSSPKRSPGLTSRSGAATRTFG